MLFHFSTCRRTRNTPRALYSVSGTSIQHAATSTNTTNEQCARGYYPLLSSPGGPQDTIMDTYASWVLPTPSVGTSPVSSQDSCTSSPSTPTGHSYAIHEVKLESLVKLVDSSFRRMISDYKLGRPGGIVLSSDAGCPKLAAISPVLFSPGYVKVQSVTEVHDAADALIQGCFAAYCATAYDCAQFLSGLPPHGFEPLET